ncbi:MAG: ATP-binding cassette domain-containing protein [Lawsonella clevelandensis]
MSGGERARLGLALALIRAPEILLLDEPTNHLDARGRELVAKTIREHPGIVVLATHDRDFLDATCTHIGDIVRNREGIGIFTGNWTQYDKHRRHERQLWEHQWRTEEHQRELLETTIEKGAREVSPGRVRQDNDNSPTTWPAVEWKNRSPAELEPRAKSLRNWRRTGGKTASSAGI